MSHVCDSVVAGPAAQTYSGPISRDLAILRAGMETHKHGNT